MSYRRIRRRKLLCEINIVPYIDVTFVLLVIFMMTAPLQQRAVEVNLPVAEGSAIAPKDIKQAELFPLIISLQQDGNYYLSEQGEMPTAVLLDLLLFKVANAHKNNPKIEIYLKADRDVSYGKILDVMEKLKQAGVPHLGLVTRSAEQ